MSLIKVKSRGTDNVSGRKNLIINGAMNVNQRGTVTTSNSTDNYGIDRFRFSMTNSGTVGMYSDTTVPTGQGFGKSQKIQWTSQNNTLDAADFNYLNQPIEGQNLQHLKFGTSSAETLTLSFWVRSSVTGNYACGLYQADGDKNFVKTYTISSADTWQFVVLNFAGNTSDTIANDNTRGLEVFWGLAFGSNYTGTNSSGGWTAYGSGGGLGYGQTANVSSSTSNTWYITGVQLEVGDSASDFEHRSFGEELLLCKRYYQLIVEGNQKIISIAHWAASTEVDFVIHIPSMRTRPTLEYITGNEYWRIGGSGGSTNTLDNLNVNTWSTESNINLWTTTGAGGTAGYASYAYSYNASAKLGFTSEL